MQIGVARIGHMLTDRTVLTQLTDIVMHDDIAELIDQQHRKRYTGHDRQQLLILQMRILGSRFDFLLQLDILPAMHVQVFLIQKLPEQSNRNYHEQQQYIFIQMIIVLHNRNAGQNQSQIPVFIAFHALPPADNRLRGMT